MISYSSMSRLKHRGEQHEDDGACFLSTRSQMEESCVDFISSSGSGHLSLSPARARPYAKGGEARVCHAGDVQVHVWLM